MIEQSLLLKLKERYRDYGIGDDILSAFASSICGYFDVAEEELNNLVESQNDFFKTVQRVTTKRITKAMANNSDAPTNDELRVELAASVFATLAEHKGCGVMESLVKDTVEATNEIFKGIKEPVPFS